MLGSAVIPNSKLKNAAANVVLTEYKIEAMVTIGGDGSQLGIRSLKTGEGRANPYWIAKMNKKN